MNCARQAITKISQRLVEDWVLKSEPPVESWRELEREGERRREKEREGER
jgi:hypothetical protein